MKTKMTNPAKPPATATVELRGEATVTVECADAEKKGPPTFEMLAYNGGAYSTANLKPPIPFPIVVDLSGMDLSKQDRPALKDHDATKLVGHTISIATDGKQLTASGVVSGAGEAAKEVVAAAANGFKWPVSIGASLSQLEYIKPGATVNVNGRSVEGPVYVARRSRPREISFLAMAADEDAVATIAASAAEGNTMTPFAQWLEANGFGPENELTDKQKVTLTAAFEAQQSAGDQSPADERLSQITGAAKKEEERRQKIVDLTASALQDHPSQLKLIETQSNLAIEGKWTPERFELELLRNLRPQAQHRRGPAMDEGLNNAVIEAGLCLSLGIDKPEKHFNEQTLDAAQRRWAGGLSLGELLGIFARRNGYNAMSTKNVRPLLEAAFARPQGDRYLEASGISTITLPGILSATANKMLKASFDAVEQTWRAISDIRTVNNFYTITSYSLTGDLEYEELPPGGQIKHGTLGEVEYTNQAKTYAKMLGIDRRDIINDDLGAFQRLLRRLGRGGALKFNKVFWTAFMNNASFFAAGENNYLAGATVGTNDTRLNQEGLGRADLLFRNQTDEDGQPLAVTPRILLVPNALAVTAANLMNSNELRDTTANSVSMTSNPFAGRFSIVVSSYLSNSTITGNSATAWYLLADPNDIPVIESVFLNGVQTPTVEQADADFNQLGIQMRGYHDFGVALQEPKGGVKLKGAA